ncbi:MAG: HDOD domain-containing protein, partial [Planctomycetes bacterium]|nr:HDOD domain-containing protein [Planctomycetota bacterium]
HMIGLLVMDQFMPAPLAQIRELVEDEGMELLAAEEEILGFDHGKIGAILLKEWHIPEVICDAVKFHLFPDMCPGDSRLAATILIGDNITRALGFGFAGDAYVIKIPPEALTSLGLIPEAFEAILQPIDVAVDRAQIFMKMV